MDEWAVSDTSIDSELLQRTLDTFKAWSQRATGYHGPGALHLVSLTPEDVR